MIEILGQATQEDLVIYGAGAANYFAPRYRRTLSGPPVWTSLERPIVRATCFRCDLVGIMLDLCWH